MERGKVNFNSSSSRGGSGRGRAGRGNDFGRGGNYQQNQGGRGGGRSGGTQTSYATNRPPVQLQQQSQWRPSHPFQQQQPWGSNQPRPIHQQVNEAPRPPTSVQQIPGGRVGAPRPSGSTPWTGRQWAPRQPAPPQPPSQQPSEPPSAGAVEVAFGSLNLSEKKLPGPPGNPEEKKVAMKRPGIGTLAVRSVGILVNQFKVRFNFQGMYILYSVDIQHVPAPGSRSVKKSIPRSDMRLIKDKLFADNADRFPADMSAYDGEKLLVSAVPLPTGQYNVELSDGDEGRVMSYVFTIKEVNTLMLSKLIDYLSGRLPHVPRDILQGMDLVMKENPSRHRVNVGRSFYSREYRQGDDLNWGIAAYRGFQHSLKPTAQGLVMCLDYCAMPFRKPLPVLEFLNQHINGFRGANDVIRLKMHVIQALRGLKVRVTHRVTKQKYTIQGLTKDITRNISFDLIDPEGSNPPRRTGLVEYFREKYGQEIMHRDIPCLDIGRPNKPNHVPMEFCILVEGQIYRGDLEKAALNNVSLPRPWDRRNRICEMVRAQDGPCGAITHNFGIEVDRNMTTAIARVIGAPDLKLGASRVVRVDNRCQWNLVGKSFVEGKRVLRWALIDFTAFGHPKLDAHGFINKLRHKSRNLGMPMEDPLVYRSTGMREMSSVSRLEALVKEVIEDAGRKDRDKLQIIVCVMTNQDPGYKNLKWVSEIQIGVLTQCCLSKHANKGHDQYLGNLCLKINAKLGGSNMELIGRLPHFRDEDFVMFIGADVNHPGARNTTCPSIAAVVGSVNWPAANRYAARISSQDHRVEKILNFGKLCLDLVNTFARLNGVRPKKIVVFRDGVSEGQFDMVLNEEFADLIRAFNDENYQPTITLVVAQKRHQTRLFLENSGNEGGSGNVPPGTVVDTTIVHPFEFDFYLCSHDGILGTSKPTHYYVLWDENSFTPDELQKLIYDMCFISARCTKPVSLVPPVYYADLVAYRGRLFQEVAMDLQSPSSFSSSAASSSSSSLAASSDLSFHNLHSELQNVMFFV